MTNEEMFSENINIAYKIANKYLINYQKEYEDIKQIALLGLWKAVLTYKQEKGFAFSSYACRVIQNEVNFYLRKNAKKINQHETSLQTQISDNATLEDVIESNRNEIEELETKLDIEPINKALTQTVTTLNERDKQIYDYIIKGYTQTHIAEIMNINQTQVCRIRKKIIREAREKSYERM